MEKIQQKNWGKSKKFVSGYFKTKKKRKKVPWTTKPLGGGGQNLSGPTTFCNVFP